MESSFQFKNPVIKKLVFEVNDDFNVENGEQIDIPHKLSVDVEKLEENTAVVSLIVEVGEKNSKYPFYVSAVETSMFRWDESVKGEDALLNQNAPALLLSYLRPTVAMVTAATPFGSYNLPFINFKVG